MKKIIAKCLIGSIAFLYAWSITGATPRIDPTRPPKSKMTSSTPNLPLQLTAIFIYPNYSVAIISGKAVKVGDQIDEFTVTTIRPFTVELSGPQNIKEVLQLLTPIIQKR